MERVSWAVLCGLSIGIALLWGMGAAEGRPPRTVTSTTKLDRLALRVQARSIPIETPEGLRRWKGRLSATSTRTTRVLHLGDSHIAADLISDAVRLRLQARFGDGGRGLMPADQRWGFGGRLVRKRGWRRSRVVDPKGPGRAYGTLGVLLQAERRGAYLRYRLREGDEVLHLHYRAGPTRPGFALEVDAQPWQSISARAPEDTTQVARWVLPASSKSLVIRARGRRAELYGLAVYRRSQGGLVWSSIGPVGADAKVFLQLQQASFQKSLAAYDPDLVVLTLGGNDALKIRKRWKSLETVEAEFKQLLATLRAYLPRAEVVLMAPMDAGRRRGRTIRSRAFIREVRQIQRRVAKAHGVAYWDTFAAMGGDGSAARWVGQGLMQNDLVHPRGRGADLLGELFARSLLQAVDAQ